MVWGVHQTSEELQLIYLDFHGSIEFEIVQICLLKLQPLIEVLLTCVLSLFELLLRRTYLWLQHHLHRVLSLQDDLLIEQYLLHFLVKYS